MRMGGCRLLDNMDMAMVHDIAVAMVQNPRSIFMGFSWDHFHLQ